MKAEQIEQRFKDRINSEKIESRIKFSILHPNMVPEQVRASHFIKEAVALAIDTPLGQAVLAGMTLRVTVKIEASED